MTFDLRSGKPVDWSAMFEPGFLPSSPGDPNRKLSALTHLYRMRYSRVPDDQDCRNLVLEYDPFTSQPILWLDSRGDLVAEPYYPHATQACATPMVLSAADLAPHVADPALRTELRQYTGQPTGQPLARTP